MNKQMLYTIRWSLGIIFLAMIFWSRLSLASTFFLVAGLFVMPIKPVRRFLRNKFRLRSRPIIIISLVIFAVGCVCQIADKLPDKEKNPAQETTLSVQNENITNNISGNAEKQTIDNMKNNIDYNVGANKDFATINAALQKWEADGFPVADIHISDGEYREKIIVDSGKTINFIGESRDGVIIKTTTGNYEDSPFHIRHGNVQIRNLTVIAEHSENSVFSYRGTDSPERANAIRIDGGNNTDKSGKVLIKNVTAISYQAPAFMLNLIPNSTIRLENCKSVSYTDKAHNGKNVGTMLEYGSVYCSKSSEKLYPERGNEKLELANVEMHSENYENSLYIVNNANGEKFNLTAVNNELTSNATENGKGNFVYTSAKGSELILHSTSRDNSDKKLNYSES